MTSNEPTRREQLLSTVLYATTLEEIRAARGALTQWVADHPEERLALADGFALLASLEEAVCFETNGPVSREPANLR